jgi:hypothetical protein
MTLECIPCRRRVPAAAEPPQPRCECGANEWRHVDVPLKVYPITVQDKRFLKSMRIESYDEPRKE